MTANPTAYRTKIAGRVDRLEPLDAEVFEPVAYVAFGVPKSDDLKGDRDAELTRVVTVKLDDFVAIPKALADELIVAFRRHGNAQRLADLGLEQLPNADHVPADAPPILDLGPTPVEVVEAAVADRNPDYAAAWIESRVPGFLGSSTAQAIRNVTRRAAFHPFELRRLIAREEESDTPRLALIEHLDVMHLTAARALETSEPTANFSKMSPRDVASFLKDAKPDEENAGRWPALAEHTLRYEAANRRSKNLLASIVVLCPELADIAREVTGTPKAKATTALERAAEDLERSDADVAAAAIDAVLPRGDYAPLPGEDEGGQA